jgi:putative peptidoglycan lipid II flippase
MMSSEPGGSGTRASRGGFGRFLQRSGSERGSDGGGATSERGGGGGGSESERVGDGASGGSGGGAGSGGGRGGGVGLLGAAGIVALGFLGSRVLGLLRTVAIADAFGTEPELAAYQVAFRLPDLVFQLLAGATLSAAFIPVYSRVVLQEGREEAWRLASRVLNLVSVATFVAAGVAWLLAPLVVPLLAPDLGVESGNQEAQRELAIDLTRLMLLSPVLFGISGMLTGILNARQHFAAPALAPMIYNASIIFGAMMLAGRLGVEGLAWGVVIGAAGHLLVQVPALSRVGMQWSASLSLRSAAVLEVLRLMGPRVVGLGASQVNLLVLVFFASFVSDAAINAVNYAFLMMMLPVGVVGMAVATAAFPTFAQQAAAGQIDLLRGSVWRTLRGVLFLAVPASVGLMLLAEPAVRLLLERGAFDAGSTDLVVGALVVFGAGVFAHAGIEIVSRGFYALEDTRTPVLVAVLAMGLNVLLALALVGPFELRGLAAAASVTAIVEFVGLVWLLHGRIDGFDTRGMGDFSARLGLSTLVMALVIVLMRVLLAAAGADVGSTGGALLIAVAGGAVGALAFAAASIVLLGEEYQLARRVLGR